VLKPIVSERLLMEPLTQTTARRLIEGDLEGLTVGEGFPPPGLAGHLENALSEGYEPGWIVTMYETAIGFCGPASPVSPEGDVDLRFEIGPKYRGLGHGRALARAVSNYLLVQPGVQRVVVSHVPLDAAACGRVLERVGFELLTTNDMFASYGRHRIQH